MAKIISPHDLVPMDLFADGQSLAIDLIYQKNEAPNIFGVVYRKDAKLWLHKDLARIVVLAAQMIHEKTGLRCILYDGLRTVEAQALMGQSPIVQKNPHWLEEPGRLLSPPGAGAHPRGMAIDMSLQTADGYNVDMGTTFDFLAENASAESNPAHRDHPYISAEARKNRIILTEAMIGAAAQLEIPLAPLPQEWWDFRLPADVYNQYAPLSDAELPPQMRLAEMAITNDLQDFPASYFKDLKRQILASLPVRAGNAVHNDSPAL